MRLARPLASCLLLGIGLYGSFACTSKRLPIEIEFSASWGGRALTCEGTGVNLTDLRLYVSDILLVDSAGEEYPLQLTADGRWQQGSTALLDFENGEGSCINGTAATNTSLVGTAAISQFDGLRFIVGVPFESNHANPLLAEAPLDDAAMHWHWRSGYKFMRAGVAAPSDSFWIHLGSTGCEGTVQNISGCRSPNRVTVELSEFNSDTGQVVIDLGQLFAAIDLEDGVASDCSSGPAESACAAPFDALGLDFAERTNTSPESSVFRVSH
jgi:uncharacterized repeat protein (TIGR04052 family)